MRTSKAVISIFADEYGTFDSLLHDLEHDILQFLNFVFKISGRNNERPDVLHCRN